LRAAAVAYVAAMDRYDTAVRQGQATPEQLDLEVEHRQAVARAFEELGRMLERFDAAPPAGAADGAADGDLSADRRRLADAVRAYVRAEREREAASAAFLARRLGLDEFQIACAAVRTPELELRQALINTAV
jgi:hypothetical protein